MEPIEVSLLQVSVYGVFIRDDELITKKKWLKEFFPELVDDLNKQYELLYRWRQKLYELTDEAGLYILDSYGPNLDYYLGVVPFYPWENTEMKKHTSKESATNAILEFLDKYFELTEKQLETLKSRIKFHNNVFIKAKGE